MRQRYHHFSLWEDWLAGMYGREPANRQRVTNAGQLLASQDRFRETAETLITEWPHATEHNLTDRSQNRRAWLGQAAALYATGSTQLETCIAWNSELTDAERYAANRVADEVIHEWCTSAFQLELHYA